MVLLDNVYVGNVSVKFLQFSLKVLELGIFLAEVLQVVLGFAFP